MKDQVGGPSAGHTKNLLSRGRIADRRRRNIGGSVHASGITGRLPRCAMAPVTFPRNMSGRLVPTGEIQITAGGSRGDGRAIAPPRVGRGVHRGAR